MSIVKEIQLGESPARWEEKYFYNGTFFIRTRCLANRLQY